MRIQWYSSFSHGVHLAELDSVAAVRGSELMMHPTRLLARPMLGAVFVVSGIDVWRNPQPRVNQADDVVKQFAPKAGLPPDTELLVKVNAATHVIAGSLLAIGKLRRFSALALLASMIPTTYAGHRFWEIDEPKDKGQQKAHFLKNVAIAGGLLLEAVDTEGKPSMWWRSRHSAQHVGQAAAVGGVVAKGATKAAKGRAAAKAAEGLGAAKAAEGIAVGKAAQGLAAGKAAQGRAAAKAAEVVTGPAARQVAETAYRAKALKDVAGKAIDGHSAKELAQKAAKVKAVSAVAHRVGH